MAHAQYLVIKRSNVWWVTLDGSRTGPYDSEKAAVDEAIIAANVYVRGGHTAEVAVDEPDDGVPTVYRAGSKT